MDRGALWRGWSQTLNGSMEHLRKAMCSMGRVVVETPRKALYLLISECGSGSPRSSISNPSFFSFTPPRSFTANRQEEPGFTGKLEQLSLTKL